jgi:predicted enzyme related to lactoylglutathione lyase
MFSEASDLWPDVPVRAPDSPATFSHSLRLDAEDVDGTTERARRSGAAVERPPADQPYGRAAVIVDPFGHRWILLRRPAGATRFRQGDVANVTMLAPDANRAKEFYEAVLQVPFSSAHLAYGVYGWAAFFLVIGAANLAGGYWYLSIDRSAPAGA